MNKTEKIAELKELIEALENGLTEAGNLPEDERILEEIEKAENLIKMLEGKTTKTWLLTCSVDGVNVDFECVINSDIEPGFWECYTIAQAHGCDFFNICENN
jgi:hypothetical protein